MSWDPSGQTFGALLRHFRLAANLTQEELAEAARLGTTAIQALERGRRTKPRKDTIAALVAALQLTEEAQSWLIEAATGEPMRTDQPLEGPSPLLVPPTALVGRDRELAELELLLDSSRPDGSRVRLVTLTGMGGVGKTRLALELARRRDESYPDGVAFVELASLEDYELLASKLVQGLGLRPTARRQPEETVLRYLEPRTALLVLDNFEHLRPAAKFVARILSACPNVSVVATSRTSLRVRGERVYRVQPLGTPHSSTSDPNVLKTWPSVQLFVARAQDTRSDFELTAANARAVADICRKLDGLPLALELAATWIDALSPSQLLRDLTQRLNRPDKAPRDLPAGQQTLTATLERSHELLSTTQRTLFRRLAVFAGGCTLTAVQEVCSTGEIRDWEIVDDLESLVDHSLLRQEGLSEDLVRYAMLQTVREFALEKLVASGELQRIETRHAAYYLQFTESAARELRGPNQAARLSDLEVEHDNLRAALTELQSDPDATQLRLVAALAPFWVGHGHLVEGRAHIQRVLARDIQADWQLRARALNGDGILAWHLGDYESARARLAESIALANNSDTHATTAEALKWLGNTETLTGHPLRAIEFYERSLAMYEQLGDDSGVVDAHANLGIIYRRTGRYGEALVEAEHCLDVRTRMGHSWGIASSHNNIGEIHRSRGEPAAAIAAYTQAIAIWTSLGDELGVAVGLAGLGIARVEAGAVDEGLAHLRDAQSRFRTLQSTTYLPELYRFIGTAYLALGDQTLARKNAECSLQLARASGSRDQEAITQRLAGQIALALGDGESARRLLQASSTTLKEAGELGELARTEAVLQALLPLAGERRRHRTGVQPRRRRRRQPPLRLSHVSGQQA